MTGVTKFSELAHKASASELADARRAVDRALSLAELRRARDMTQTQLANALEIKQAGVSRLEHQTDLYLSTLRSYVEALGGRLEVTAVFPDGVIPISDFADLEADNGPAIAARG